MILKSSVNHTTKTSMEIGIRIEAEDMKNGTVKHTNSCYLVAVAINDAGKTYGNTSNNTRNGR